MPIFDIRRIRRDDALEQRHGLARLAERQIARTEKELRWYQRGLEFDGLLERTDRFLLVPAHGQCHAEVHQQAGIARHGAHQFLIHAGRLLEVPLLHGLRGHLTATHEVSGLRSECDRQNRSEEPAGHVCVVYGEQAIQRQPQPSA